MPTSTVWFACSIMSQSSEQDGWMQPSQALFGHSVGLSKKAVWVSSSSAMADVVSLSWTIQLAGANVFLGYQAVQSLVGYPPPTFTVLTQEWKKKSKQITSVKNPILRKSDELLFSASFIGTLLDIKQRRQFSWNVCSVLESWMPVKLTVVFQNHPWKP